MSDVTPVEPKDGNREMANIVKPARIINLAELHTLTLSNLRDLSETLVIQPVTSPNRLAVLISFDQFCKMRDAIASLESVKARR